MYWTSCLAQSKGSYNGSSAKNFMYSEHNIQDSYMIWYSALDGFSTLITSMQKAQNSNWSTQIKQGQYNWALVIHRRTSPDKALVTDVISSLYLHFCGIPWLCFLELYSRSAALLASLTGQLCSIPGLMNFEGTG